MVFHFFAHKKILVPPNIEDALTSTDIVVREGANVTLKCRATGSPTPSVKWKRDDNSKISINKAMSGTLSVVHSLIGTKFLKFNFFFFLGFTVVEWEGETLEMSKISRLDMGAYLCIASNGVPPSVSKRIKVSVDCKCNFVLYSKTVSEQKFFPSVPPMIWIPHQLVGIPLTYNVTLECFVEAFPTSLNYWARENNEMIHDSNKYK